MSLPCRTWIVVLVLGLVTAATPTLAAPQQTMRVTGTLTDASGTPFQLAPLVVRLERDVIDQRTGEPAIGEPIVFDEVGRGTTEEDGGFDLAATFPEDLSPYLGEHGTLQVQISSITEQLTYVRYIEVLPENLQMVADDPDVLPSLAELVDIDGALDVEEAGARQVETATGVFEEARPETAAPEGLTLVATGSAARWNAQASNASFARANPCPSGQYLTMRPTSYMVRNWASQWRGITLRNSTARYEWTRSDTTKLGIAVTGQNGNFDARNDLRRADTRKRLAQRRSS